MFSVNFLFSFLFLFSGVVQAPGNQPRAASGAYNTIASHLERMIDARAEHEQMLRQQLEQQNYVVQSILARKHYFWRLLEEKSKSSGQSDYMKEYNQGDSSSLVLISIIFRHRSGLLKKSYRVRFRERPKCRCPQSNIKSWGGDIPESKTKNRTIS